MSRMLLKGPDERATDNGRGVGKLNLGNRPLEEQKTTLSGVVRFRVAHLGHEGGMYAVLRSHFGVCVCHV